MARRPFVTLRRPCLPLACTVLVLALGGCGSGSHPAVSTAAYPRSRGAAHARTTASGPTRARDPSHRRVVVSGTPGLDSLRLALARAMGAAGPHAGGAVYDLTTHRTLFLERATAGHPPASVEKLYTTTAVLRTPGADATLQTRVLGTGHRAAHGVWDGNLYFKGGGDPTLGDGRFNAAYEDGDGPTGMQIATQLFRDGIRRVTGRLFGDESLFDTKRGGLITNQRPDTPDLGGELSALSYDHGSVMRISASPAIFATQQLAATMRMAHIAVRAAKTTAITPVDATQLAVVSSPPMRVLVKLMDVPSDDFFAEMLAKQLGVRYGGGEGSIAAGAAVISTTIANDYGVHPLILDGSGLSREDRTSPAQVVTLLRELWQTPSGAILDASLPVVGKTGTVAGVALKTAAVGRCSAKTGTLNNVTNLAGYCRTKGGQMVAFAFFVDGPPNSVALAQEGQMVADAARY